MQNLFFFTESYPFGLGEKWKTNELKVISKHFEKVIIVPLHYGKNTKPIDLPSENIIVLTPVYNQLEDKLSWKDLLFFFNYEFVISLSKEIGKLLKRKAPDRIRKCLLFFKRFASITKSNAFRTLMNESNEGDTWYFFWARGWADILPFTQIPKRVKVVVRLHNYDLYLERNNGYIPFRKALFQKASFILPVSESGKTHLLKEFEIEQKKVIVSRLGTVSPGRSSPGNDLALQLLSCSGMVPVKRIDRIIETLELVKDMPIVWTHIGDGILKKELEGMCKKLSPNITVSFIGYLTADEVLDYYTKHPVDLFINTSQAEGVPVAIMEAFSAGVPVFATSVGGTSEIVDDSTGKLLDATPHAEDIAKALKDFFLLSKNDKQKMRDAAFDKYQKICNAEVCAQHLLKFLC